MQTSPCKDELLFGLALAAAEGVGIRGYYYKRTEFGSVEAAFNHTVPPAAQRSLLDAARDLQNGIDPPGSDSKTYRTLRAADVTIPKDVRWQDAAKDKLLARW